MAVQTFALRGPFDVPARYGVTLYVADTEAELLALDGIDPVALGLAIDTESWWFSTLAGPWTALSGGGGGGIGNLDGGNAASVYGGTGPIDGGSA